MFTAMCMLDSTGKQVLNRKSDFGVEKSTTFICFQIMDLFVVLDKKN